MYTYESIYCSRRCRGSGDRGISTNKKLPLRLGMLIQVWLCLEDANQYKFYNLLN